MAIPDPNAESMDSDQGRGLILIKTFMDEVIFSENGNEMRMTLREPAKKLATTSS